MDVQEVRIENILTRTTGFLRTVTSHSLQPYRGCTFGRALCGVGCYVRHNPYILQGRTWGGFLEVRINAAESYSLNQARERRWAERRGIPFGIFCSSATDPCLPQENHYGITRSLLQAMCDQPPDLLIVQTHSPQVTRLIPELRKLAGHCVLRVHVSIESDRDQFPGLPPPTSPVAARFEACAALKSAGLYTVVTVSPLLPISDPPTFFSRISETADAVVLDHFIQGDGSVEGARTWRTALPAAIAAVDPAALDLGYRDRMAAIAGRYLPGRVGVNIDGFAGRWLGE